MIAKRLIKKVAAVMCLGVPFFGFLMMISCTTKEKAREDTKFRCEEKIINNESKLLDLKIDMYFEK